jgi:hypothetical protein
MAKSLSASDLLVRETILGVIKSRDLNREGIIHTSDFRSAVADLGFPFGHPIIENILVHCVINSDGFVDFNGLERELARSFSKMSFFCLILAENGVCQMPKLKASRQQESKRPVKPLPNLGELMLSINKKCNPRDKQSFSKKNVMMFSTLLESMRIKHSPKNCS